MINNLGLRLENLLSQRTKRELILCFIAFWLGIYFLFFHSLLSLRIQEIFELQNKIQQNKIFLQKTQNQNLSQILQDEKNLSSKLSILIDTINSLSLPWFKTLENINDFSLKHQISIHSILAEQDKNLYLLYGNTQFEELLELCFYLSKYYLLSLDAFAFDSNGNFSLAIKDLKLNPPFITPPTPQNYTKMIETIKKVFSSITPHPITKSPTFSLEAIFQNKAKINGVWLKKGDKINSFFIKAITKNSVTLISHNNEIVLTLKSKRIFQ